MAFEPPREPTRFPSLLVFAVSVAVIGLVAGAGYFLLLRRPATDAVAVEDSTPTTGEASELDRVEELASRPERITIPSIGVDGPVLEMRLTGDGLWDADSIIGEVGHLQGTPWPGEDGNSVLAGHITVPEGAYGPFKDLETMRAGQEIFIWTRDGTMYTYEVIENKVVSADDMEVIAPTEEPTLTLITCASWDSEAEVYTERIVVGAQLSASSGSD